MEDHRILMSKKKKTEEDELIEFIGEAISMDSSLFAASVNLVRAGNIAKDKQDVKSLITIARAWYDIARYLGGDEDGSGKTPHFGFASLGSELDEPGDEPDESESGPEVSKKSRKLRNNRR